MLLCTLFVILGLFAACHPMILSGLHLMQADSCDSRLNNYILEHGYQWISGNKLHRDFWNPPVFFPAANTAAYCDTLLGSAPIYWLFRFLGFHYDTSFQLWTLTNLTLNFIATFILLKRGLELSIIASCGGAYLFAFGGIRISQMVHHQLLPQFFTIIAIYCLIKIFNENDSSNKSALYETRILIPVFFISLALQLYAGFYLGWFLSYGVLLLFLVSLFFRQARWSLLSVYKASRGLILLSAIFFVTMISWMGRHYWLAMKEVGPRSWLEIAAAIPRLMSWVNMGPDNWVYAWSRQYLDFSHLPGEREHRLGLGILTLGLVSLGMARMSRLLWGKIVLTAFLIIVIFTLMFPGDWTLWKLAGNLLPGAGAIRGVTRVYLLLLIIFSIALSFALEGLKKRKLAFLLLLLVCIEQVATVPASGKHAIRAEVNSIAKLIPQHCDAFYHTFIDTKPPRELANGQTNAMWTQIITGIPTINGFSGDYPPKWEPLLKLALKPGYTSGECLETIKKWLDGNGLSGYQIRQTENNGNRVFAVYMRAMGPKSVSLRALPE